jgi:aminopeptidase N
MPYSQRLHAGCSAAGAPGPFVLAGTERKYERALPFHVKHLELDVTVDLSARAIQGVATLSFERIDRTATWLELDALGFDVHGVELLSGKKTRASFEYDGDVLRIGISERVRSGDVRIRYEAKPKRGLYFLAPDDTVKDRPLQVWSQCQDEDARHWFPCHDKPHSKMTVDITARVPGGMLALANGERVGEERPRGKDRRWVFRYRMSEPLPSYLVTLVVGKFEVVEDRPAKRTGHADVPIVYWVPPGKASDAPRSLGETPRMVELFGKLTGVPYPFSRYSQVVVNDFIFGGMENTTATTLYENVLFDEKASLDVTSNDLVAHELAHHWFGDFVTCRDWSHAWLNEGFATYFEHLEREDRLGRDEYEYGVAGDCQTYVSEAVGRYRRPIVCRDYEHPIDLFDRHLYEKGGLVLHMLRVDLGTEPFFKGVRRYLDTHAHGVVETSDLKRALEIESGRSLERFFDQWVYRAGHPVLEVRITWEDSHLVVDVKQKQQGDDVAVFAFVLEVAIGESSGAVHRRRKNVSAREDALVVPLAKRPAWVAFDPDFRIVGEITVKAPADMLERQLASGDTARMRWMAAEGLSAREDPAAIRALSRALGRKKEVWMVRAEAARALGKLGGDDALRELLAHAKDPHPKVRRAVIQSLGRFKRSEAATVLLRHAKKDASYLVEAEACRSLGSTRDARAKAALVEVVDDASWADVKRAGAVDGLASLRDETAIEAIVERTRYGIPTRGRRAAIGALARLGEGRKVRRHLEDLLEDDDPYVRITVVSALTTLGDPRARGALRRQLERERDGRVSRRIREALTTLGDSARADQKQLKDDVEQLRRDLAELKVRLGKAEHKKKRSVSRGSAR